MIDILDLITQNTSVVLIMIIALSILGNIAIWQLLKRRYTNKIINTYMEKCQDDLAWVTLDLSMIAKLTGLVEAGTGIEQQHNKRLLGHYLKAYYILYHVRFVEMDFKIRAEGFAAIGDYKNAGYFWEKALNIVNSPLYRYPLIQWEIHRAYACFLYKTDPRKGYATFNNLVWDFTDDPQGEDWGGKFSLKSKIEGSTFITPTKSEYKNSTISIIYDWLNCHIQNSSLFSEDFLLSVIDEAKTYNDPILSQKIIEAEKLLKRN